MEPPEDPVLAALRALPERAPAPEVDRRIHRLARARFVRSAVAPLDRRLAALARLYGRIELGLAVGVTTIYLGWAVQTALAALGRR
jgi:hypothetical protein